MTVSDRPPDMERAREMAGKYADSFNNPNVRNIARCFIALDEAAREALGACTEQIERLRHGTGQAAPREGEEDAAKDV